MKDKQISDAELSRLLHSAVDPQVPQDLARRITMSAIAAETGQDIGEHLSKPDATSSHRRGFRFAAFAACAAVVVAVSGIGQFTGGSDTTVQLASGNQAVEAPPQIAAAPIQDEPVVEQDPAPASVESQSRPSLARPETELVETSPGERGAIQMARSEAAQPPSPATRDDDAEAIERYIGQFATNGASHSRYVLETEMTESEVYGPVDESNRALPNAGMYASPVMGYGIAGGLTPPPSE